MVSSSSTSLFTSVQILLGGKNGTFSPGESFNILSPTVPPSAPMAAIALTSSGNLDLVATTNVLNVFVGDGEGGFKPSGSYAVSGSPLLFADLSGYGKPGLIVGNAAGTFYFPGNGDGTLQAAPGAPGSGAIADVNSDGISDIYWGPREGTILEPHSAEETAVSPFWIRQ